MLEVRDISVAYGAIKGLHGGSLRVAKGEIVTLIGCTGAGKSPTLRAISGLVRPGSGDILYEGRTLRGWPRTRSSGAGWPIRPRAGASSRT